MSEAITTKPITLDQLATELGGAALSMSDTGSQRTITAPTLDQATLDNAVAAHVAIDEAGNENTLKSQALSALQNNRDDITTNDTYLAIASPTNAQVAAQVKALTQQSTRQARELNGAIRLLLNKFDGTN